MRQGDSLRKLKITECLIKHIIDQKRQPKAFGFLNEHLAKTMAAEREISANRTAQMMPIVDPLGVQSGFFSE